MASPTTVMAKAQRPNSPLSYPHDIANSPYFTVLRFREYTRQEPTERPREKDGGTIILPLPAELIEIYNITYAQPAMGVMGLAIKDMGESNNVESNAEVLRQRLGDPKFLTDAITTTTQQVISQLSETAGAAMSLVLGNAPNPHMRSIFENVPLRLFNWTWKFAPRTPDEGREVRRIVNAFRRHSLPADNLGGLRLSFPDELFVDFVGKHSDFLPKIRKCVVVSVSFNHARNAQPTFFHDGTPTHMELAVQVQEVNQITRESFAE